MRISGRGAIRRAAMRNGDQLAAVLQVDAKHAAQIDRAAAAGVPSPREADSRVPGELRDGVPGTGEIGRGEGGEVFTAPDFLRAVALQRDRLVVLARVARFRLRRGRPWSQHLHSRPCAPGNAHGLRHLTVRRLGLQTRQNRSKSRSNNAEIFMALKQARPEARRAHRGGSRCRPRRGREWRQGRRQRARQRRRHATSGRTSGGSRAGFQARLVICLPERHGAGTSVFHQRRKPLAPQ